MMTTAVILIFAMYIVSIYTRDKYCINLSPSMPYGLYKISAPASLKRGDIIIFMPPDYLKSIIYQTVHQSVAKPAIRPLQNIRACKFKERRSIIFMPPDYLKSIIYQRRWLPSFHVA